MDQQQAFEQIVAPAVLIPACGLLLMSSTARLNVVLGRIRAFHSERLEIWVSHPESGTEADLVRSLRLEGLEFQSTRLIARARLLRTAMLFLLLAIGSNLLSAVGLVFAFLVREVPRICEVFPTAAFGLGIVLLLAATVTSLIEVSKVLETVQYEHDRVDALCQMPAPASSAAVGPEPTNAPGPMGN